jgi:hypothetical protein
MKGSSRLNTNSRGNLRSHRTHGVEDGVCVWGGGLQNRAGIPAWLRCECAPRTCVCAVTHVGVHEHHAAGHVVTHTPAQKWPVLHALRLTFKPIKVGVSPDWCCDERKSERDDSHCGSYNAAVFTPGSEVLAGCCSKYKARVSVKGLTDAG